MLDVNSDNPIHPEFTSPSNNFFWEAVGKWQEVLSVGGFKKENIKKRELSRTQKVDDTFKDDNYEAYWGERLERDKKAKLKAEKGTKGPGTRGRGRGRGGKGKAKAV